MITAQSAPTVTTETWQALGTTALLRITGGSGARVRRAVQAEIDAVDAAASRFAGDSELTRLNAAGGERIAVSPLLHEALTLALRAAEVTGGAVDPTLGRSLIAAGYDRDWTMLIPPPSGSPDAGEPTGAQPRLALLRRREPAWREIDLRDDPPSARIPAGVMIDLGATAKALAADRAARAAVAAGAHGALVSLGGDIATRGVAPDDGWGVHVTDDHRSGPDAPGQTIAIRSGGLATSSTTTRRWLHGGEAMHHILDPRDGAPVRTTWRTVSVAAGSCADANIASTAAIVLGPAAADWLAAQGLPARLVALDGAVLTLGGWPR